METLSKCVGNFTLFHVLISFSQWRPSQSLPNQPSAEQDGFEIKRRGDVSVTARVILHLKTFPERFRLIEPLADILDIKEETRQGIITALWHYIKANGLQDKVDRKVIRADAKLRPASVSFWLSWVGSNR